MVAGLNCWPAANLRFRRRTERLLEPTRDCWMKSEGLHLMKKINLFADRNKKSAADQAVTPSEPSHSSRPLGSRRFLAQRYHFAQHAETVAEKTHFSSFRVIPAHRDLADTQTGAMGQIKQLHIKREALDSRCLEHRATRVEAKRFKAALRIP